MNAISLRRVCPFVAGGIVVALHFWWGHVLVRDLERSAAEYRRREQLQAFPLRDDETQYELLEELLKLGFEEEDAFRAVWAADVANRRYGIDMYDLGCVEQLAALERHGGGSMGALVSPDPHARLVGADNQPARHACL